MSKAGLLLSNVSIHFTQDQLSEISQWFDNISVPKQINSNEEPANVITIEDLIQFLKFKKYHRRNFHYPTYMEIMKEAEFFKADVTRMLTKDQFIYMLNKWVILPKVKHEIMLAFNVFDTEKRNFLDIDEIKTIVTQYGDAFSDAEVRELLRNANVRGDGNVFYNDFIDTLFNLAPELYDLKVEYLYENPDEDASVPSDPVTVEESKVDKSPPSYKPPATKKKREKPKA